MAGRSHKPDYWGSPLDMERKAAARVLGVLGRVCGLLGLAGPDWEESGAAWCAAEEKRRRGDAETVRRGEADVGIENVDEAEIETENDDE